MGWWSTDIMGGDEPLDFQDEIYDLSGIDNDYDIIPKKKFDLNVILDHFTNKHYYTKSNSNWMENTDEGNVFYQVLGVIMMKSGIVIPDELKEKMIKAAENDEWASEEDERKEKMDSFISTVKSFDGTPIIINSKGLFETIKNNNIKESISDTIKLLILANVEKNKHENVNKLLDQLIDVVSKQEHRA